jgi:hypothetical protein
MDKTTRDSAVHLREQLDQFDGPALGVVANAIKARRGGRHGYGYHGATTNVWLSKRGRMCMGAAVKAPRAS